MKGIATNISKPKRRTYFMNALKIFLDICEFPPSYPIILDIQAHFFLDFCR